MRKGIKKRKRYLKQNSKGELLIRSPLGSSEVKKFVARVVYLMKYRIVAVCAWRQNEVDLVEREVRY